MAKDANTPDAEVSTPNYAEAIAKAQSALDAIKVEAAGITPGDIDAIIALGARITAAQKALDTATKAEEAASFALKGAERQRVKEAIEALGGAPVPLFNEAIGLGMTLRYVKGEDGQPSVQVIMPAVKGTPRAPREGGNTGGSRTRHQIAYNGEVVGSRTFIESVSALEGEAGDVARAALERIEKAKAEGKFSPGFDGPVKKLIEMGVGSFV